MKLTCNVIQDLLPSYVDDICSNDTKILVEEHVEECSQCKEKLNQMKYTGITAEKAATRQIDYLKKVRTTITHRESLGKLILTILVAITFIGLFAGNGGLIYYEQIPSVVFTILLFCAAGLAGNYHSSGKGIITTTQITASGILFIFALAINEYVIRNLIRLETPFPFLGMELYEVGPFYATILKITALFVIILLTGNTFGKQKNTYATILNITALTQIAYVNDWLYHVDTPQTSLQFAHELAISQMLLAVVGITAYALLRKFGKNSILL